VDLYLRGSRTSKRIGDLWEKQREAFDKAIKLLPIPGQRVILKSRDGSFEVPAIYYAAGGKDEVKRKKPALISGNGYDGAQKEMRHSVGFAALEKGWKVITYKTPGQPSVVREQGLGFIYDWEKAVVSVVDFLKEKKGGEVDMSKIGLVGFSVVWVAICACTGFWEEIDRGDSY